MCNKVFFSMNTRAHLARKRLKAMIEAKTHWIVGVTPEVMIYAWRLAALHVDRCGEQMTTLCIHELRMQPLLCTLPKDKVSLDDLLGVIGPIDASREVIESKEWIDTGGEFHGKTLEVAGLWHGFGHGGTFSSGV